MIFYLSQFRVTMESKIPQYNTRIQLPKSKDSSGGNYEGKLHLFYCYGTIFNYHKYSKGINITHTKVHTQISL